MDGNLPVELMENILSLLPVKSLLRFTTISKSWDRIITSHPFVVTHFRQANSTSHNLMIPGKGLIRLDNKKVHDLPMGLKYPLEISTEYIELCYCNGLILAHYGDHKGRMYVVWNPSTRVCVKFECPYDFFWETDFHGLCYDPLVGDCKVVIWNAKKYAVFNCKSNHWTEAKDVNKFMNVLHSCAIPNLGGLPSSNGDHYWLAVAKREAIREAKIICFDSKEETFEEIPKLPKLPITQRSGARIRFSSAGNHLGVQRFLRSGANEETFLLKKDGGQYHWKQIDTHFATTTPDGNRRIVHMESENEILLAGPPNHPHPHIFVLFLYNSAEQSLREIENCSQIMLDSYEVLVPFPENLFCFK